MKLNQLLAILVSLAWLPALAQYPAPSWASATSGAGYTQYARAYTYDPYAQYREDWNREPSRRHQDPGSFSRPRIQLALILDVSGSMDGLIEQAKSQLWTIVNGLMAADYSEPYGGDDYSGGDSYRGGRSRGRNTPRLEIALFEYGNIRLGAHNRYMRRIVPFTADLDWISDELFHLYTGGSAEYAGEAIDLALGSLNWSGNPQDLRLIYIAGNEHFDQGAMDYRRVIRYAAESGIWVNTIYCGDYRTGVREGWEDAARIGGGEYLNIDHNYRWRYESSGWDQQLSQLNGRLNDTYIPYGAEGLTLRQRQLEQDRNASQYGQTVLAQRAIVKASGSYQNENWDLVDAVAAGRVRIAEVPAAQLPAEMRSMSVPQREAYVARKASERAQICQEIQQAAQAQPMPKPAAGGMVQQPASGQPAKPGTVQPAPAPQAKTLDAAILQSTKIQQMKQMQQGAPRPAPEAPALKPAPGQSRPQLEESPAVKPAPAAPAVRPVPSQPVRPGMKPAPQPAAPEQELEETPQLETQPAPKPVLRPAPAPPRPVPGAAARPARP
ncbi:MAG: hypothetical protein NW241_23310 [Bacteroidia bacterium]|nr:hypothetical protein [Bacteroidia bacterium]